MKKLSKAAPRKARPAPARRAAPGPASAAPERDPVRVFQINGKRFAAGLYWHALSEQKKRQAEMRAVGKKENFAAAVLRHAATPQAGFSPRPLPRGTYSFAAALAGAISGSWIGVFEIEDGCYVLCAVSDGVIVPGSDMAGSAQDICRQFAHVRTLLLCDKIFAPAALGLGGEPLDAARFLVPRRLRKDCRMSALRVTLNKRQWVLGALLVSLLAGAGVGAMKYSQYREQQRLEEEMERLRLERERRPEVPPWEVQPDPHAMLRTCRTAIGKMPLALGGWLFDTASCGEQGVRTVYKRIPGSTVKTFAAAATTGFPELKPVFQKNYDEAALTVKLPALEPRKGDALMPSSELTQEVYAYFQAREQTFSLKQEGGRAMALELTSQVNPADLMAKAAWPGFRVSTVEVSFREADLTWKISGKLYAK